MTISIPETGQNGSGNAAVSKSDLEGVLNTGLGAAQLQVPGSTVYRTLASRFSDSLSVFDFGVVGTGSDDYAVIQAAINAAAGHAVLTIPPGLYFISQALQVPASSNIVINGTLRLTDGNYRDMITIIGNDVIIEGTGALDGNRANLTSVNGGPTASGIAILYPPPQSGFISNVYIAGLEIYDVGNFPVNFVYTQNLICERCTVHDSGNSPQISHSNNCHFLNCLSYNISDDGLALYGFCTDCSIKGCTIYNCDSGPIILSDTDQPGACDRCSLIDNICHDNSAYGVMVQAGLDNAVLPSHTNCVVTGNISDNNGASNFRLVNVYGCIFSNNITRTATSAPGLPLQCQGNLQNITITNNIFGDGYVGCTVIYVVPGTNASNVANTTAGVIIENNIIFESRSSGNGAAYGIQVIGNSIANGVIVRNNILNGVFSSIAINLSPNVIFEGDLLNQGSLKTLTQAFTAGNITANGVVASNLGVLEVGNTTTTTQAYIDFHSSGNNQTDARRYVSGGNTNFAQGNVIEYFGSMTWSNFHNWPNYANDAAAGASGVQIDQWYNMNGQPKIRVS